MPVRYGSYHVHDQFAAVDGAQIADGINHVLTTHAGWTAGDSVKAYVTLTATGQPANNETIRLDINGSGDKTYTFKTTLTVPAVANEILIGTDAPDSLKNLYYAINDVELYEGTKYGTGTVGHTRLEAVDPQGASTLTIQAKTAGGGGSGIWTQETIVNASLNSEYTNFGGYWLKSAKTPAGLQFKIFVYVPTTNSDRVYIRVSSMDDLYSNTAGESNFCLLGSANRTLEILACEYQFFIWLAGSSSTNGTVVGAGVPYLRTEHQSPAISSVANTGGEFEVTLAAAHGLTTGDHVYVSGATKNTGAVMTAMLGWWPILVTGTNTYRLTGSVYEAGYDASSGRSASALQTSSAVWAMGQNANGVARLGRSAVNLGGDLGTWEFTNWNQYSWVSAIGWGGTGWGIQFKVAAIVQASLTLLAPFTESVGGRSDDIEAKICWPTTATTATHLEVGELWGAFIVLGKCKADYTSTNPLGDNHNFICMTDGGYRVNYSDIAALLLARN